MPSCSEWAAGLGGAEVAAASLKPNMQVYRMMAAVESGHGHGRGRELGLFTLCTISFEEATWKLKVFNGRAWEPKLDARHLDHAQLNVFYASGEHRYVLVASPEDAAGAAELAGFAGAEARTFTWPGKKMGEDEAAGAMTALHEDAAWRAASEMAWAADDAGWRMARELALPQRETSIPGAPLLPPQFRPGVTSVIRSNCPELFSQHFKLEHALAMLHAVRESQ